MFLFSLSISLSSIGATIMLKMMAALNNMMVKVRFTFKAASKRRGSKKVLTEAVAVRS